MIYGPDLALIHDRGFAGDAAGAVLRLLGAAGHSRGLVVDLGCGSGVLAGALAEAGFDVLGIDISPDMVRLARARAPSCEFVCGSIAVAGIPPCIAVTAIGEVMNYITDEPRADDLRPLLGRIRDALLPGGLLVFDIAEPGRCPGGERRVHTVTDEWAVIADSREDRQSRTLTRTITTFVRHGGAYRRSDEVHRLRLYPRDLVRAWTAESGFEVHTLAGYGAAPFPPGLVALAARKLEGGPGPSG